VRSLAFAFDVRPPASLSQSRAFSPAGACRQIHAAEGWVGFFKGLIPSLILGVFTSSCSLRCFTSSCSLRCCHYWELNPASARARAVSNPAIQFVGYEVREQSILTSATPPRSTAPTCLHSLSSCSKWFALWVGIAPTTQQRQRRPKTGECNWSVVSVSRVSSDGTRAGLLRWPSHPV
jgi:hypothetical protein